jgi:hypothetical protein
VSAEPRVSASTPREKSKRPHGLASLADGMAEILGSGDLVSV